MPRAVQRVELQLAESPGQYNALPTAHCTGLGWLLQQAYEG